MSGKYSGIPRKRPSWPGRRVIRSESINKWCRLIDLPGERDGRRKPRNRDGLIKTENGLRRPGMDRISVVQAEAQRNNECFTATAIYRPRRPRTLSEGETPPTKNWSDSLRVNNPVIDGNVVIGHRPIRTAFEPGDHVDTKDGNDTKDAV